MIKQENEITEYIQKAFEQHFYEEDMGKDWRFRAARALDYTSPLQLGITPQEFKHIRKCLMDNEPLNWLQYASVSNNLQSRSRDEMNMTISEYDELMTFTADKAEEFNAMTKPVYDTAVGQALSSGRDGKNTMYPVGKPAEA
jgi:hypothetical protein